MKRMYHEARALFSIYTSCSDTISTDSKTLADIRTWMESYINDMFVRKQLTFREDGIAIAKAGIICGETYIKKS